MDRATQERWCAALRRKGVAAVQAELDLHPGRPTDSLFDMADAPPYPTRAFCEAWCRNGGYAPPASRGATAMAVGMALLFVVCVVQMLGSLSAQYAGAPRGYAGAAAPLPEGAPPPSDDGIANTSVISTRDTHTILPGCTWVAASDAAHTVRTLPACARLGTLSDRPAGNPAS